MDMEMTPILATAIVESLQRLSWYEICSGGYVGSGDMLDIWVCIYNRELNESFVQMLVNIAPHARYERENGSVQPELFSIFGPLPIQRIVFDAVDKAEATRLEKAINDIMKDAVCITRERALFQILQASAKGEAKNVTHPTITPAVS